MKTEHGKKISKWKILKSKVAFRNPWWEIRDEIVRLPDGSTAHFYVNHSCGGVAVFPVTENGRVVLVRQYKHGARAIVLELPCGHIDSSDGSRVAAARRELREETGYAAQKLTLIRAFPSFPTSSTSKIWIYIATGCRKVGAPKDTAKEITDTLTVSVTELRCLVASGRIASIMHVGAIYAALEHLKKL
jgi:ADP-ribose pyrophosphatase